MADYEFTYSRPLTHIGVAVTDLDRAVAWYREALGWAPLAPAATISRDGQRIGELCADCFPGFQQLRVAHMSTGNGVGVELFEWTSPPGQHREGFPYWCTGPFHIAVVSQEVEATVERILRLGGKQRTAIWELYPGQPYRFCFCEDPFGNVIELSSHPYEMVHANQYREEADGGRHEVGNFRGDNATETGCR